MCLIFQSDAKKPSMLEQKSKLPIFLVQIAFGIITVMIVLLLFFAKKAYTELSYLDEEQLRLVKLSKDIEYYDEVLTMSARLAVSKQDLSWEERYLEHVPFLDKAIEETLEALNQKQQEQFIDQTKVANENLIDMEEKAFTLAHSGEWHSAEKVLYSEDYAISKTQYANGLQELSHSLKQKLKSHQASEEKLLRYNIYLSILLLISVILIALFVSWTLNRWSKSEQLAYKKLTETNAELEEFAYRTSHDLRSPIISSIRLLDMTEKSINKNEVTKAGLSLSHARNSLQKLEVLIKDILVLTEAKNKEESSKNIEIDSMVEIALHKMEHMESFERLNIETDFQHKTTVHAKESRVNMILENLISNAIKYQNLEEENPYIKISTVDRNNRFILEVKDNGLGIPANQQDKLFTMFKRFHPKIAFGSGLGLYLMKKSADVLNAEISFEDNDGGSAFTLSIPH